jgi:hypothetical protein
MDSALSFYTASATTSHSVILKNLLTVGEEFGKWSLLIGILLSIRPHCLTYLKLHDCECGNFDPVRRVASSIQNALERVECSEVHCAQWTVT